MPRVSVLVVAPAGVKHPNSDMQLNIVTGTARDEFKFQADIELEFEIVDRVVPGVYDNDYNICLNPDELDAEALRLMRLADTAVGSAPRRRLVIFVCKQIMNQRGPDQIEPRRSNGLSPTGMAVCIIPIQGQKSMVGDGDGQTWAHEIGHGLGLDHTDTDGDDNLMHPSRHAGGRFAGFAVTGAQKALMHTHCEKLNAGI